MNNCTNDAPTPSLIQPQPIDCAERKRQRERKRYAQMSTEQKNEVLERSRAQQKKLLAGKERTFNKTKYISLIAWENILMMSPHLHHVILLEQIETRRAWHRENYAGMTPKQKSSKKALRALRRNSLNKESIAMENPCWTPEVVHTNVDASGSHGFIPTCDWHISEFSGTLFISNLLPRKCQGRRPRILILVIYQGESM